MSMHSTSTWQQALEIVEFLSIWYLVWSCVNLICKTVGKIQKVMKEYNLANNRLKCIMLYCLYISRKYMYNLQKYIIRTSSKLKVLSLRLHTWWGCHNQLHKYRSDNNPPKFLFPSSFGLISSYVVCWSP